jgi:phosphoglycolate phosphatase-like HAD superfamily hydrolase
LNLDLKKCLFVGDTIKDMQVCRRAGCKTLLVQTGQGEASLKKILEEKTAIRPDWVGESLAAATPLIFESWGKA